MWRFLWLSRNWIGVGFWMMNNETGVNLNYLTKPSHLLLEAQSQGISNLPSTCPPNHYEREKLQAQNCIKSYNFVCKNEINGMSKILNNHELYPAKLHNLAKKGDAQEKKNMCLIEKYQYLESCKHKIVLNYIIFWQQTRYRRRLTFWKMHDLVK